MFGIARLWRLRRWRDIALRRCCTFGPADASPRVPQKSGVSPASRFSDLSSPASWYPLARNLKRRVIAHVGPTNSGKTHAAMQALMKAKTGIYCAPLRLLAWEGYERLRQNDVRCSLLTGQEAENTADDTHMSCTVEMANVSQPYEVAVVDEYQLMGDKSRGWAFTRVILGIPANVVYVCGPNSALALLHSLCTETGDILEVAQFQRLTSLDVEAEGIKYLENIRKGDCLVAFRRRDVHDLKSLIETNSRHSCCMVYGALPPESRKKQAELFNSPDNDYDILIASDAIGMGLNLNIRRIVFTSIEKYDGTKQRFLSVPEVKQISGRAGRYGARFPSGFVSCIHSTNIPFLKYAMQQPNPQVKRAGLFPRFEQLSLLADHIGTQRLPDVIDALLHSVEVSPNYFLADLRAMRKTGALIQHLPLTLQEQYLFVMSPIDGSNLEQASEFLRFCTAYARYKEVPISCGALIPKLEDLHHPKTEADLQWVENIHAVIDAYLWLAHRLPGAFCDMVIAKEKRHLAAKAVEYGLESLTLKRRRIIKTKNPKGNQKNLTVYNL